MEFDQEPEENEYFTSYGMYQDLIENEANAESDQQSISYLEVELKRLLGEEQFRKDHYNSSRAELQEIWNKIVGLQGYINTVKCETENVKIECIVNHSDDAGGRKELTIESANRLASAQGLKEKIRQKEGLRVRLILIADKLKLARQQLSQLTDSLTKSIKHNNTITSNEIVNYNTSSSTHQGSIATSMSIRNLLVETSRNIEQLEADQVKSSADFQLLEKELSAVLDDQQFSQVLDPSSADNGGQGWKKGVYEESHHYVPASGNNGSKGSAGGAGINHSAAFAPAAAAKKNSKLDKTLLDVISHGAPLSKDLIDVLKKGAPIGGDAQETVGAAGSSVDQNISLADVESGAVSAAVQRMNGEEPAQYLVRLQRRLSALELLLSQAQKEFNGKVDEVKKLREQVRHACMFASYS